MTIAACYLSPEGVVLGTDSTSTIVGPDGESSYLDHAQKLFAVGDPGTTIGLMTWGLGQIGDVSHRTIAAMIGDELTRAGFSNMRAVADFAAELVWVHYADAYSARCTRAKLLRSKHKTGNLSTDERSELRLLGQLAGGYCIAGRMPGGRACTGFAIDWAPWLDAPALRDLRLEQPYHWGVPEFALRLIYGWDHRAVDTIMASGKWTGTPEEFLDLLAGSVVVWPRRLPIREAADWIHTLIHTTIRGTKFAQRAHACGGPIEIAAISSDRPFRWVCHKRLDSALVTAEESMLWRI